MKTERSVVIRVASIVGMSRRLAVPMALTASLLAVASVASASDAGLVGGGISFADASPMVGAYGYEPGDVGGHATTGVGGGTFNLNTFLGADRYYTHDTPINGQNAVVTNLEAGHAWNGHETLNHVATFINSGDTWGGGAVAPLIDRHATWVAMLIGGRRTQVDPDIRQQGLAPGADLRSAAVATHWNDPAYSLSFGISVASYITAYDGAFGASDVVNSSYGYGDSGGTDLYTVFSDAVAYQNPWTTHVVSAGNTGPGANTVGAPGAGYNTIAVAALGDANGFDSVASFSSRAPQDFAYYDENADIVVIPGVRAAVDIAAPGSSITSAFYGGQTGGNNDTLTNSTDLGSDPVAYSANIAGTSFSAPLVAGGATLVASAAKTLPELSGNPEASRNLVVKALLLTGTDKTDGWDNGQQVVTVGQDSVIQTTQSLDWAVGAGRMNLDRTFDIQVNGQLDVPGLSTGAMGSVVAMGWDFGHATIDTSNDYVISEPLLADTTLSTTLAWERVRLWDTATGELFEIAQADLNLSVWMLDSLGAFDVLIASSESLYNPVEHLSFTLPETARYGLRVSYEGNSFDNTLGTIWGSEGYEQVYGLAWHAVPIPEPSGLVVFVVSFLCLFRRIRGVKRRTGT